jgi:hypothetical protein
MVHYSIAPEPDSGGAKIQLEGGVFPGADANLLLDRTRAEQVRGSAPSFQLSSARARLLNEAMESARRVAVGDSLWRRLIQIRRRGARQSGDEAFLRRFTPEWLRAQAARTGAAGRLGALGE